MMSELLPYISPPVALWATGFFVMCVAPAGILSYNLVKRIAFLAAVKLSDFCPAS